ASREEFFGPITVLERFEDEAEGVARANSTRYGLAAGGWTADLGRAHRGAHQLDAGIGWVNKWVDLAVGMPLGGGKGGGLGAGRERGAEGRQRRPAAREAAAGGGLSRVRGCPPAGHGPPERRRPGYGMKGRRLRMVRAGDRERTDCRGDLPQVPRRGDRT